MYELIISFVLFMGLFKLYMFVINIGDDNQGLRKYP